MLNALRRSGSSRKLARDICDAIGNRAREPVFFTRLGVPDTIDGRFDLLVLHACLVLERLRERQMDDVSQFVVDRLFTGFDESLRELGVGDIGIGHRMKKMADAFYGRLAAYNAAADVGALKDAVLRNVFRGEVSRDADALALAHYVQSARDHLEHSDLSTTSDFGPLPA